MGWMGNRRILLSSDLAQIISKEQGISVDVVKQVLKGLSNVITRDDTDVIEVGDVVFYKREQEVVVYIKRYQSEI